MTESFAMHLKNIKTDERIGATPGRLKSIRRWRLGVVFGCMTLSSIAQASDIWPAGLHDASQRIEAIKAFADGITRNDSEAIDVGWQGRDGWNKAITEAETDAGAAKDPQAFGLVIRRLYARYPSLHSHMELRADIDYRTQFGQPYLPFTLKAGVIGPGVIPDAVFISSVSEDRQGLSGAQAVIGDHVKAINGRPISYWLSQAAIACRRNSQWQCYDDFDKQLRNGVLEWDPRQTLQIEISRGRKQETLTYAPKKMPARSEPHAQTGCGEDATTYQGFELAYTGWNLCTFRSAASPGVEIWRLRSFNYGENAIVDSPKSEVARFWERHWKAVAPSVKKLIIDVSGNGGGDVPLAWYSLILDRPYQEQYAQYRRLQAYDDAAVASEMSEDPAHEKWLANLKRENPEAWNRIGDYLPPVPMFCADDDTNCSGQLVTPKASGFTGDVSLVIDDNCVSSCSGFSWNVLDKLGTRAGAFGLPDSGDSDFRRLPLKLFYSHGKWLTSIGNSSNPQEKPIVLVSVMVAHTTTSDGRVISGRSQPVQVVVNRLWNDTANSWAQRALNAALSSQKGARGDQQPQP